MEDEENDPSKHGAKCQYAKSIFHLYRSKFCCVKQITEEYHEVDQYGVDAHTDQSVVTFYKAVFRVMIQDDGKKNAKQSETDAKERHDQPVAAQYDAAGAQQIDQGAVEEPETFFSTSGFGHERDVQEGKRQRQSADHDEKPGEPVFCCQVADKTRD